MGNRRSFLKALAGSTAALAAGSTLAGAAPRDALGRTLPTRALGATGETVTMLGLGGAHVNMKMDDREAQRTIEAAIEGGVRFFDNAEGYGDGLSERRYGKFLTPKYREHVFLMTKTRARNAEEARRHLEGSLRRMNTDYLDLWQMHHLRSPEDVDGRLENGVLDVLQEAKQQGKVRHIGFTGHRMPEAHARMLERTEALETVQMPINAVDPTAHSSFIEQVLPTAHKRRMGVLAMKTLSNGGFFRSVPGDGDGQAVVPDRLRVREAEQFVWSLPVSTLITGADHAEMLQEKIEFAEEFERLSEADRQALVDRVAGLPAEQIEQYKA